MNILKKFLTVSVSSIALGVVPLADAHTTKVGCYICGMNWKPYIGLDLQLRHMPFEKGQGDDIFKKNIPQMNPYVGVKFNPYFGIEGGGYLSQRKKTSITKKSGDVFLGGIVSANISQAFVEVERISGWHLSAVGFLPIMKNCPLQLYGSAGIARVRMHFISTIKATDGDEADPFGADEDERVRHFKSIKYVPRLSAGIQYMINERIGIRGGVTWEKTKKFSKTKRFSLKNGAYTILPRNTFIYSLGFLVNI